MVKFGDEMEREIHLPWKVHYLDYKRLKKKLKQVKESNAKDDDAEKQRRKGQFRECFDSELQKILSFYRYKEGEFKAWANDLVQDLEHCEDLSVRLSYAPNAIADMNALEARYKQWLDLAKELLLMLRYLRLNITGFRKILKKASKHGVSDPSGTNSRRANLRIHIEHPTEASTLIEHLSSLPEEMGDQLQNMQRHSYMVELAECIPEAMDTLEQCVHRGKHAGSMVLKFPRSRMGSRIRARNCITKADALLHEMEGASPVLEELQKAIDDAAEEASLMQVTSLSLEAQAGLFAVPETDRVRVGDTLGLAVNLCSTLLYMVNYNIVTPMILGLTDRLQMSASLGGLIIGASDITAMLMTVVYSVWTNKAFKPPLLFAAVCCLLGNIFYSLSFDLQSFPLLLLGRLMNGMGAARGVSRRYIADYVPKTHRTGASAAFVASSTMGMALGPVIALPMSRIQTSVSWGSFVFHLNDITLGGWLMAITWLMFALWTAIFYREPRSLSDVPSDPESTHVRSSSEDAEPFLPSTNSGAGVSTPLLAKGGSKRRSKHRTASAIFVCFMTLFVLKFVQQGFIASVANVGPGLFAWGADKCGFFLSVVNLSMLPVNFAVATLSYYASDRIMLLGGDALGSLGCLFLVCLGGGLTIGQYSAGALCILASTVVMEAVSMSLMSKKLPKRYSAGTFNMGLLATEAGTLGRFGGNLGSTIAGRITGVTTAAQLVRYISDFYGTLLGMSLVCITSTTILYKRLKTS